MTVPALLPSVRSRQRISGLGMIEQSLAVGPMYKLKIAADVVAMAGCAVASLLS